MWPDGLGENLHASRREISGRDVVPLHASRREISGRDVVPLHVNATRGVVCAMATHSAVAASGSRVSRVGQLIIERSLSTIASSREALSQAISTLKSVPAPTCATSNRTQRPGRTSACDVMKLVLTSSGIENRSIALPPANRPVLAPTAEAIAASAIWIGVRLLSIQPTREPSQSMPPQRD